jgi:hypothetical protein
MTARLTIVLGPDVLKALRGSNSIRVAAGSSGGAAASRPAPAAKDSGARPGEGGFRPGSLPAKLMAWAGELKKPFGVPDLMRKFKIKRGHASMLIAYVSKGGAVKRVGRGEYRAA